MHLFVPSSLHAVIFETGRGEVGRGEVGRGSGINIIAELAERSPIIIQNSSDPSSRKNLDVRPYDRTTVQVATFNMRGQLCRKDYKLKYLNMQVTPYLHK